MNPPSATFVFGRFVLAVRNALLMMASPPYPPIALEILREFSASEFIGKVYVRGRDREWVPVHADGATSYDWFKDAKTKKIAFDMENSSARWSVLYFRGENAGTGPYLAVAIRLEEKKSS